MAAARVLLSLADIALGAGVDRTTAVRWAQRYRWEPVRQVNRRLGRPALYDYEAVQRSLAARQDREAKAA
jgi:hypothetical protein